MQTFNPFIRVTMMPNFATGHIIQWKIDPTFAESEPYTYIVECSQVPTFSELSYTFPSTTDFSAVDDKNEKQAIYVDLYYRVKLTTADGNTYYSKSVIFGSGQDTRRQYKLAAEITRKELLRMRKFTGMDGFLLKRKSFGQVRKDSVDPITGTPITNNVTDFGTGIDGGYFDPIKVVFSYEDDDTKRGYSADGFGVSESYTCSLRMVGFPAIDTYDILVDPISDARYIIKDVKTDSFPATAIPVVQVLTASQLPVTDPVYQIKVQ